MRAAEVKQSILANKTALGIELGSTRIKAVLVDGSNMPIASSQSWNSIHGREKGQAEMDEEGKQTMRVLARNMTFLMKSIELGKKEYGLPETEEHVWTHFI